MVIDYLPPAASSDERLALAQQIAGHGFTPWVTDVSLVHLGVGSFIHQPREVALLYHTDNTDFAGHDAHNLLGAITDYYGLNVRPYDVAAGLPDLVQGLHVGVITWFDGADLTTAGVSENDWQNWLIRAMDNRIPLAMFGQLPIASEPLLSRMGVAQVATAKQTHATLLGAHPGFGDFEAPPPNREAVSQALQNNRDGNTPWLVMEIDGQEVVPVLTGSWGGYAQHPYLLQTGFEYDRRWLVDPFKFIKESLHLPAMPMPDTTTENGLRILLSHVDGDGFPSRAELPGTPYSAEVLYDQVFKPIDLPHTVSVIEGEVAKTGLYPHLSEELEPWARKIFALPNVELASHSFSHPFFWSRRDQIDTSKTLYGLGLPIPDYVTDMRREVAGSIDYINTQLAPEGKRTEVFLWTGDAVPDGHTIGITREIGVANLNGGNTQIRNAKPSMTYVSPQSRWTSQGPQIYAPIMNENVYTNDWTGPFHGFRRVIQTFERTEKPRRLKPLSIYYHFYSGTKPGALNALLDVYKYVAKQPHTAMYISEYAKRVEGYHTAQIIRSAKPRTWQISELGALRTLRLPPGLGVPDVAHSTNVVGWREAADATYVHLSKDHATLVLADKPANEPSLIWANSLVEEWSREPSGARVRLRGYEPVRFAVRSNDACRIKRLDRIIEPVRNRDGEQVFELPRKDTGEIKLVCS